MKKLFFLNICVLMLASMAWGQAEVNLQNEKIHDIHYFFAEKAGFSASKKTTYAEIRKLFNGRNVYFFSGFDFENYESGHPNLTQIRSAEVSGISLGVRETQRDGGKIRVTPLSSSGSYSIIGHSQGGLRALGYASHFKNTPNSLNRIDAIITISGIDQGLKALDGGLAGLKATASSKVNIVGNGLRAALGVSDIFAVLANFIPRNKLADGIGFFMSILPPTMGKYWEVAWRTTNIDSFPQLRDMVPRSQYIRDNVVDTKTHTYKVKTGSQLTSELRSKKVLGIKVWYLWIGYVDTYKTVSVDEVTPKFNPALQSAHAVPLGFIVGLDNKSLSMADNEKAIRDGIKAAEIAFGFVQGVHVVKSVSLVGLLTGSVGFATDANRARELMANIDSELYDIIGSKQGDGLVAFESQFIPQKFTDPNTKAERQHLRNKILGKTNDGIVRMSKFNHKNIAENTATFTEAQKMIIEGFEERVKQKLR